MVLAFLVWWFWTLRAKTQGIFNCAEGSPWNGGPLKYWIWLTWIYGLSKLNQLALALQKSPLMWCLVRNFSGISRCIQGAFVGQGNSASIEPFPIFTSRCLMINCRNSATSVCRSSCSGQIVRFLSFGMVVGSPPHPEQRHSNDMLYLGEFIHVSQRIGNIHPWMIWWIARCPLNHWDVPRTVIYWWGRWQRPKRPEIEQNDTPGPVTQYCCCFLCPKPKRLHALSVVICEGIVSQLKPKYENMKK